MDFSIPRPIFDETFEFIDADCKFIADYLASELNITFKNALKTNIVKTVRYDNDPFIPLVDFPVLKVYKSSYQDILVLAPQVSVKFTIAYALAFTKRTNIVNISVFVAEEIRRLLKNASLSNLFQLDSSEPISIEFEDFINPENVIYRYVTINCNIYTTF